jgi:hypothetical protein
MLYKIGSYTLLLDWGAFCIAAAATGNDAVAPLKGIPSSEAYAVILYAGVGRKYESDGVVSEMTLQDAKDILKGFRPAWITKLDAAWSEVTSIDIEEGEEISEEAKKK